MAIDTLAYAKHLEGAGVPRPEAEAQAEALTRHVLPDLATKADLEELKHDLTMRVLAIPAALNGILFALLRFVH
jgi:hypothetical protein